VGADVRDGALDDDDGKVEEGGGSEDGRGGVWRVKKHVNSMFKRKGGEGGEEGGEGIDSRGAQAHAEPKTGILTKTETFNCRFALQMRSVCMLEGERERERERECEGGREGSESQKKV